MKRTEIKKGYESNGLRWGGKIWLVLELDRKRAGRKDCYCVLGHSASGWWHLFYGTLSQCRDYIEYEEGRRDYNDIRWGDRF